MPSTSWLSKHHDLLLIQHHQDKMNSLNNECWSPLGYFTHLKEVFPRLRQSSFQIRDRPPWLRSWIHASKTSSSELVRLFATDLSFLFARYWYTSLSPAALVQAHSLWIVPQVLDMSGRYLILISLRHSINDADNDLPGGLPGTFPNPPIRCWVCSNKNCLIASVLTSLALSLPMIWKPCQPHDSLDYGGGDEVYIQRGSDPECIASINTLVTTTIHTNKLIFLGRILVVYTLYAHFYPSRR